jgi:hypothetical protein
VNRRPAMRPPESGSRKASVASRVIVAASDVSARGERVPRSPTRRAQLV